MCLSLEDDAVDVYGLNVYSWCDEAGAVLLPQVPPGQSVAPDCGLAWGTIVMGHFRSIIGYFGVLLYGLL